MSKTPKLKILLTEKKEEVFSAEVEIIGGGKEVIFMLSQFLSEQPEVAKIFMVALGASIGIEGTPEGAEEELRILGGAVDLARGKEEK